MEVVVVVLVVSVVVVKLSALGLAMLAGAGPAAENASSLGQSSAVTTDIASTKAISTTSRPMPGNNTTNSVQVRTPRTCGMKIAVGLLVLADDVCPIYLYRTELGTQ